MSRKKKNANIDLDLVGIMNYPIDKLLYDYKFSPSDIFECIEKHSMYPYSNLEILRLLAHDEFGLDDLAENIRLQILEDYPKYR